MVEVLQWWVISNASRIIDNFFEHLNRPLQAFPISVTNKVTNTKTGQCNRPNAAQLIKKDNNNNNYEIVQNEKNNSETVQNEKNLKIV